MINHFSLDEFVRSDLATARGIDNSLPDSLADAAHRTLEMAECIREHLCLEAGRDVPMHLSSGYRCPALNWVARNPHAEGQGEDASGDHPKASAIDFEAPVFGTPREICVTLAPHLDALGIGQLIFEGTWVHASWRLPMRPINRVITINGNGPQVGIV